MLNDLKFINKPSRFPEIRSLFMGKKKKNLMLFCGVLFPNVIAALLEGFSYTFILLAFTALSNGPSIDFKLYPILSQSPISLWIQTLSPQKAFTLFIVLAISFQILRSGFTFIGQVATTFLGTRLQAEAQEKVYKQILAFSFPFVSNYKIGDLVEYARIPSTLMTILTDPLNQCIISGFAILASVVMMLFLSIPLTLLAIFIFGLLALSQKFLVAVISRISRLLTDHLVHFSKYTVQSLHALRVIHVFNRQATILERVKTNLNDIAKTSRRLSLINQIIVPINEIMGVVLIGFFLVVGQWIAAGNETALPTLLTFITILHRLNTRLHNLITCTGTIAANWGSILRMEEILTNKGKEFSLTGDQKLPHFSQEICFHNVSLQYQGAKTPSIEKLNLVIPKGATTAFIGASGAGKSSIIDLLLRLYDPTEGEIRIDQIPLKKLEINHWRNQLGVVSQDTFVFNDTIYENIRFGKLEASLEEVIEAAKMAGAHGFIERLPHGYYTELGERGYRLSGGERQRIALARALIRNPEILILDEATSNLDTHSEKLIQEALTQFEGKKTVILVAHRLSTVVHAHKIIVLEQGQVVESGSHQELLIANHRYASYWNAQAELSNAGLFSK